MIGIIVNMIQDHKIDDTYTINGRDYKLVEISETLKRLVHARGYSDDDKKCLNEIRNLVLSYKEKNREEFKSNWESSTLDDYELTWAM